MGVQLILGADSRQRNAFAERSQATTHDTNGSLPMSSNLCRPPSIVPHGVICQIDVRFCGQAQFFQLHQVNSLTADVESLRGRFDSRRLSVRTAGRSTSQVQENPLISSFY